MLKGLGYSFMTATSAAMLSSSNGLAASKSNGGYFSNSDRVKRNKTYLLDRPITPEEIATKYNNYYEFGSHKEIWRLAQDLPISPWAVTFDGLVERKKTVDFEDLVKSMQLEERLYRHRCVERWSMAVPYTGFPLSKLVDYARPLGSAKYLIMQSFMNVKSAPGQRQFWYPWPYIEGLTMAEAMNDLAFIATGYYGKPLPKQNGAPLRLAVPWKYGFKHIKGIVRFTFSDIRPISFWEEVAGSEYGFWANVAGAVPHARWSQANEQFFGPNGKEQRKTKLYNGYAEYVAHLYRGMEGESLFK
tara:strand:- start:477 stop:1382 length:906 start_codon:yes stop_codon:yes gene_type:complete